MAFKLEQIDHAIEWAMLDEVIAMGSWPDKRTFLQAADTAGYQAAVKAMITAYQVYIDGGAVAPVVIEVFGVGAYQDKEQLKRNNIIIERTSTPQGEVGFAYPFQWQQQSDYSYKQYKTTSGTRDVEYEIRTYCLDADADRKMTTAILKIFGGRKSLKGMNDDLTKTVDSFDTVEDRKPVNLSGENFNERIFTLCAKDIELAEDIEIGTAKAMVTLEAKNTLAVDPEMAAFPDDATDASTSTYGPIDLMLQFVERTEAYRNMDIMRVYAQNTSPRALNGRPRRLPDATNTGATFTAFKGFSKNGAGQFLSTKFDRTKAIYFAHVHCSWSFMFIEDPGACDVAGFIDGVSDFYVRHAADGLYVTMNGIAEIKMSDEALKKNVLYVLNKPVSFMLELWSAGELLKRSMIDDPKPFTSGEVYELSTNGGSATAAAVTLCFSAYGGGLRGSAIAEWTTAVKKYFAKLYHE